MKLNALAVTTNDFMKSIEFYQLLGFQFPEFKGEEQHVETLPKDGEPKLMIDSVEMMKSILGEIPKPGNHSSFAVQYDSAIKLNKIVENLVLAGFKVVKKPWDAPWGQRYSIVEDPAGYKVDLYAIL